MWEGSLGVLQKTEEDRRQDSADLLLLLLTLYIPRGAVQVQKAKAAVGGSGADDFIGKTVKVVPTPTRAPTLFSTDGRNSTKKHGD